MYCPNCGTQNADQTTTCTKCGAALNASTSTATSPTATVTSPPTTSGAVSSAAPIAPGTGGNVKVASNLPIAIISIFFSVLPGIIAIVYAAKVSDLAAKGDLAGAQSASKKAKIWAIIGLCLGVVIFILQIIGSVMTKK